MTDEAPARNKGGRPAKYPGEGRRPTLSLRVRGGLYERIQASAENYQRTMSEEMEARLQASFEYADIMDRVSKAASKSAIETSERIMLSLFGSEEGIKFGRAIAEALKRGMNDVGRSGESYHELKKHPDDLAAVQAAIMKRVARELSEGDGGWDPWGAMYGTFAASLKGEAPE